MLLKIIYYNQLYHILYKLSFILKYNNEKIISYLHYVFTHN